MTSKITVATLTLIWGSFSSVGLTAGPAVDTVTVAVDFEMDGFGSETFDFPLSEPVSMERLSAFYVGAFLREFDSWGGRWTMSTEVSLLSEGKVVASTAGSPLTGASVWSDTGRVANFASDMGVVVDAIRFRQTQAPIEEEPATGIVTLIRGTHEGGTVKVHFIRGPLGPDNMRNVSYDIMEISVPGRTSWQESHFVPVPARHLRFLFVPILRYWWSGPSGSTMTEAEFILDDGTHLRMDDLHSPSTGEFDPGRVSNSHALLLDEDTRARLEDREITGWRIRVARDGEGTTHVRAATPTIYFVYDYDDCNGNDVPDVDEGLAPGSCDDAAGPRFLRGDANDDGKTNISDPLSLLSFKFLGADAPECADSADANDDGVLDTADAVTMLLFLFAGGAPLSPPVAACGADPTDDALDCETFRQCEF